MNKKKRMELSDKIFHHYTYMEDLIDDLSDKEIIRLADDIEEIEED